MLKKAILVALCIVGAGCQQPPLTATRTKTSLSNGIRFNYMVQEVAGWDVIVEDTVWLERPGVTRKALDAIGASLSKIAAKLPAQPLTKLRTIPIYLTDTRSAPAPLHVHRSKAWLAEHGEDVEKVDAVDVCDPDAIASHLESQELGMLLELSFAFQQRFFTADDKANLLKLFNAALAEGKYGMVASDKGVRRSFASASMSTYFAVGSEAYWGRSATYPHTRADLKEYDPRLHDFMESVWMRQ